MALTIYLSLIFLALYLIGLAIQRWLFWRDRRRMADESRGGGRVIAKVDDLTPGSVKKFWLICQKYRLDAPAAGTCRRRWTLSAMNLSATTDAFCAVTPMARFTNLPRDCASTAPAKASRSIVYRYASIVAKFSSPVQRAT